MKRYTGKGQASLEFLLTYGWAFIAIIAVFGVITYMGLSTPERFTPQSCIVGESFECTDFAAYHSDSNGYLVLNLQNQVGHRVNINEIEVRTFRGTDATCSEDGAIRVEADNSSSDSFDVIGSELLVEPGASLDVRFICTNGEIRQDDLIKSDFTIRYKINKSGYFDKNVVGSVIAEAGLTIP